MVMVPKYSRQGGEVSLPTRRLSPMSSADAAALAAPGRAMSYVGNQMQQVGQQLTNIEVAKMKEEARLWTISKETELETSMVAREENIQLNTDPDDYINNESIAGGSSPDTYTNRVMGGFQAELDKKDDKGNQAYKPPNKYAEQMWAERLPQIKSAYKIRAMRYEGDLRSKARLQQLINTGNQMAANAFDGQVPIDTLMNRVDILTDGKDDPTTPDVEGYSGLIKAKDLIGVAEALKADIVSQAVQGYIKRDPLAAFATLIGKHQDIGDTRLHDALKFLSPSARRTLTNQAKQAAIIVHEEDLMELADKLEQHTDSLSRGGEGLPDFNSPDGFQAAFVNVYGGRYGKIKLELIPELKRSMDVAMKNAEKNNRIARASGMLVNGYPLVSNDMLPDAIRNLELLMNMPAEELSADVLKDASFDVSGILSNKLTNSEMQDALAKAIPIINQKLELRSSDFAEFAIRESMVLDTEMGPDRFRATRAFGKQLGMTWTPLLTNAEATKLKNEARSASVNPEAAAAWVNNLEQQHGSDFDDIWKQLTTGKNPLEPHWQFMGAFSNTNLALAFSSAATSDLSDLKTRLEGAPEGSKFSDVQKNVFDKLGPIVDKFTGGMPQNDMFADSLMVSMQKMVMEQIIQSRGSMDAATATDHVLSTFKEQIYFPENNRLAFYVTPSSGLAMSKEGMVEAMTTFFDNEDTVEQFIIDKGIRTPKSMVGAVTSDIAFRNKRFAAIIAEQGVWSINADGDGVYLTIPINAGSEASAAGGGMMVPVTVTGPNGALVPFEIKFSEMRGAVPYTGNGDNSSETAYP